MTTSPRISIIMPCFQQVQFLEEAVRSVLDQRDTPVELIVMEPGSVDGSRELLLELKKEYPETLILHFFPDSGQADAINRGISMARGNVIGWLNSDDRLRPGSLSKAVSRLDKSEPGWLYGRCGIIDTHGRQISRPIVWYKNWRGKRFTVYKLLTEDFIPQMATFWNRSLFDKSGGLDTARHLDMDYDLFLRFALICKPETTTLYLADFRVHSRSKGSSQTADQLKAAIETARHYSGQLGIRGKCAFLMHRIFSLRTRLIYIFIKP